MTKTHIGYIQLHFGCKDEQIPSPSTSYKTGTNAMCDTPTADIDIIVSNEVDRLWDAVVSEQTAKTRPLSAIRSFV